MPNPRPLSRLIQTGLASAIVLATATAQPGNFTSYGQGCGGVLGPTCSEANMSCATPSGRVSNSAADRWAITTLALQPRTISGVQLRMRATAPITFPVELWTGPLIGAPTTLVRTGTMSVGTTYGDWGADFSSPYSAPAFQGVSIVIRNLPPGTTLPICSSGTQVTGQHYQTTQVPYGPTFGVWIPLSSNWSFRLQCGGSVVPTQLTSNAPMVGQTMALQLSNGNPNSPAWFSIGDSNTSWAGLSLPLDLSMSGAPGCFVNSSSVLQIGAMTDASGAASLTVPIPNNAALTGAVFYNQGIVSNPTFNQLGLTFSNGGRAVVGMLCNPDPAIGTSVNGSFGLPRIDFFGFPGFNVQATYAGVRQKICCSSTGPKACRFQGSGTLTGNVGQFSIPITALGKVVDDINAKVCSTLIAATGGSVNCSAVLGISVGGVTLNGNVSVDRNDCSGLQTYSSQGSLTFPGGVFGGADMTAGVSVPQIQPPPPLPPIPPITGNLKFKLGVTGTPSGSWSINQRTGTATIRISSVRVTGTVNVTFVPGVGTVGFDHTIATPQLTATTPAFTLPFIPVGC